MPERSGGSKHLIQHLSLSGIKASPHALALFCCEPRNQLKGLPQISCPSFLLREQRDLQGQAPRQGANDLNHCFGGSSGILLNLMGSQEANLPERLPESQDPPSTLVWLLGMQSPPPSRQSFSGRIPTLRRLRACSVLRVSDRPQPPFLSAS